MGNKVNTSAIKNNLTTSSSGYVLDARQGKALGEYALITDLAALKVWRRGKVYTAVFEGAKQESGTLVTLAAAHRPPYTVRGIVASTDCTVLGRANVGADGTVEIARATSSSTLLYGSVTWTISG